MLYLIFYLDVLDTDEKDEYPIYQKSEEYVDCFVMLIVLIFTHFFNNFVGSKIQEPKLYFQLCTMKMKLRNENMREPQIDDQCLGKA